MRIVFYAKGKRSGLSNNGGSRTILKSAEALHTLGHDVDVVAKHDSFTWFKHPEPKLKVGTNTDALIAVSARDVDTMCKKYPTANKFWWIRGIELWQFPEQELIEKAKKVKCIVNASHMKTWLAKHGINSTLCYSGMDNWYDGYNLRRKDRKIVVGCLYNKNHKTKGWESFKTLADSWGTKEFRYIGFGNDMPDTSFLSCFIKQPTKIELEKLYNICDIWFSDTTLEGFHNVPAEAAMCGCLVMCNNAVHNGMSDYATEETAKIFHDKVEMLDQEFDFTKVEKMKKLIKEKIGSREENMKRLVKLCQ